MGCKIAYIAPFKANETQLDLIKNKLKYRHLESSNLAYAINADYIHGCKNNTDKLLNKNKRYWTQYDVVIILNLPTFPELIKEDWYYDFNLIDDIRKSNPSVKIGIHTEGWPSHFMKTNNMLIVGRVIQWLQCADFIVSTERKIDVNYYKAFNQNVFYIPYPVPEIVRLKNGKIRDIKNCRISEGCRKNIVLVGGRWYIGEVNGYTTLKLAGKIANEFNMKIKIIDVIPKSVVPKINGINMLKLITRLPLSRIIWQKGNMSWEEYHKSIANCRLMVNLNDKYTFGRAGIDCAITRVPMVAFDCVETANQLFPKTTAQIYDFEKAEKIAKKLIQNKRFWRDSVDYADSVLSEHSFEKCRKLFLNSVLEKVLR